MAAPVLVRYDSQGEIVDVEEFEVARAILAGHTQRLSQQVQSKHLFEICIAFGHQSTAAALLTHGVPGCRVELCHLGPFAGKARLKRDDLGCKCGSPWRTCDFCCWGSELADGVWIEDWDAELANAVAAAQEAAGRPVARAMLAALRSGKDFRSFDVSEAAMARLLDLAILTGDADLAQRCAQRCTRRPLRRWCSQDFFDNLRPFLLRASAPDVTAAAILSGVTLQELSVEYRGREHVNHYVGDVSVECPIPLREAIALCGDLQLWQRLSPLLPERQRPWIPRTCDAGWLFCLPLSDGKHKLCLDRLRTASLANLALSEFVFGQSSFHTFCAACQCGVGSHLSARPRLLDVAIFLGQSACAELLASCAAASATAWTRQACLPDEQCDDCGEAAVWEVFCARTSSLTERRVAGGAALRAALARAPRLAAPMGLGVYQVLLAWGRGKEVPSDLVNIVLSFAAERPQIACVLEGLEEELLPSASLVREQERVEPSEAPEPAEALAAPDVDMEGDLLSGDESVVVQEQEHPSEAVIPQAAESRAAPDVETEGEEGKSTNDLLTAVRNSRNETVPLSSDGVVCFRLTRKANAPHVNELLFNIEGPLAELHRRVLDAGCEVAPEWSPVKALFVPLTQAQLLEFTGDGRLA